MNSAEDSPYEYASDLHWLWGWRERIRLTLEENSETLLVGENGWMCFMPCAESRKALDHYRNEYGVTVTKTELAIEQLQTALNKHLSAPAEKQLMVEAYEAIVNLQREITDALETIGSKEIARVRANRFEAIDQSDAKSFGTLISPNDPNNERNDYVEPLLPKQSDFSWVERLPFSIRAPLRLLIENDLAMDARSFAIQLRHLTPSDANNSKLAMTVFYRSHFEEWQKLLKVESQNLDFHWRLSRRRGQIRLLEDSLPVAKTAKPRLRKSTRKNTRKKPG